MNLDVIFGPGETSVYVWGAFGLCLALMAAEVARLRRRMRGKRFSRNADSGAPAGETKMRSEGGNVTPAAQKGNDDR